MNCFCMERPEGYTVAASTGFCRVWEGASALTSLLESDDFPLRDKLAGKRVLELGSQLLRIIFHFPRAVSEGWQGIRCTT